MLADAASRQAWSSALSSPFASVVTWFLSGLSRSVRAPRKLGCELGFSFPLAGRIAFF